MAHCRNDNVHKVLIGHSNGNGVDARVHGKEFFVPKGLIDNQLHTSLRIIQQSQGSSCTRRQSEHIIQIIFMTESQLFNTSQFTDLLQVDSLRSVY